MHMGADHHTWTMHVQFTHEYNQAMHVCAYIHMCTCMPWKCTLLWHAWHIILCCIDLVGDLYWSCVMWHPITDGLCNIPAYQQSTQGGFLNQAYVAGLCLVSRNWFCLEHVCVCMCPPFRLVITSGVMWHDMYPIWLANKVLQVLYGSCSFYH